MHDTINHSFIIRITIEPSLYSRMAIEWKGMILDVISGERSYFNDFEQMVDFIAQKTHLNMFEDNPQE